MKQSNFTKARVFIRPNSTANENTTAPAYGSLPYSSVPLANWFRDLLDPNYGKVRYLFYLSSLHTFSFLEATTSADLYVAFSTPTEKLKTGRDTVDVFLAYTKHKPINEVY